MYLTYISTCLYRYKSCTKFAVTLFFLRMINLPSYFKYLESWLSKKMRHHIHMYVHTYILAYLRCSTIFFFFFSSSSSSFMWRWASIISRWNRPHKFVRKRKRRTVVGTVCEFKERSTIPSCTFPSARIGLKRWLSKRKREMRDREKRRGQGQHRKCHPLG